jgi:metallo-beta-lactamase class B
MKTKIALGLLLGVSVSLVAAQAPTDPGEVHIAAARTAAGEDYTGLFNDWCTAGGPGGRGRGAGGGAGGGQRGGAAAAAPGAAPAAAPAGAPAATPAAAQAPRGGGGGGGRGTPDRSTWYAEPVKVFDNLYFFGQTEYSAWALTSTEGIILIDAIFDYSVEEEVEGGMKKLGLDPTKIKYALLSHAHADHYGGGQFLQEKFGARPVMGGPDWDTVERANGSKPKRDIVATDGQKITVGDVSVTIYLTPGHTPGNLSYIFQVKDNGQTHTAALWGGTGLNADKASLTDYVASAKRFAEIAKQAGADIILSNHTAWDRSKINLPIVAKRTPGTPNPYITNNASVLRFLRVAEGCAAARLARLP